MARGRFISNAIMSDKKVNELSDDTSRLAFTWLITEADCEGRVHGDPAMVRSLLFPRRNDITIEQMESYINEWHQSGLVRWYKSNDDLWIWFPNFEKYQVGLRKEREPSSQIPPLDDGELQPMSQQIDGEHPANIRQTSGTNKANINKAKLKEGKVRDEEKTPRPTRATLPPAVIAYREAAHRYPNKSLYSLIDERVGSELDRVNFWHDVVVKYIALGWNPSNITGQLEWFDRNELPNKNGNGQSGNSKVSMLDAIREAQKDPNYGK